MADEAVEPILDELRAGIQDVLGPRLVGVYLYGSYVIGGSLAGVSDLDLLAATAGDITPVDLGRLREMHAALVRRNLAWDDRIEAAYLSTAALASFKKLRSQIAVISPGEPLHFREERAGADWLMNWHLVRTGGRTLFGPAPESIIALTTDAEFIESLRDHVRSGESWVAEAHTRKAVSYVTLTLCRTLVAIETGRHSSKPEAAEWVARAFPQWVPLVEQAVAARDDPRSACPADDESVASMRDFFRFVQASL